MGIDKVIEVELNDGRLLKDGTPLTDHPEGAYYLVPKEVAEDLLSSREEARKQEEGRQEQDASFRTERMSRERFDTFPDTLTINGVDYFLTAETEELPGKVVLVRYLSLENSLDRSLDDDKHI